MTASMMSSLPPRSPNCAVRLILCRHGETSLNAKHILQGSGMNPPLNEAGEFQARRLAKRLGKTPLDLIISSHLTRAQQTAGAIAQYHKDVPYEVMSDLAEICWGVFEGKMSPDLSSLKKAWDGGDFDYAPTGGESPAQVCVRVERAFSQIMRRARALRTEPTVAVVAHGRFLRIALSWLLHRSLHFMETITHTNCNLNVLDVCLDVPTVPLHTLSTDTLAQLSETFCTQQCRAGTVPDPPRRLTACKLDESRAHALGAHLGAHWTFNSEECFVLGRVINDTEHLGGAQ